MSKKKEDKKGAKTPAQPKELEKLEVMELPEAKVLEAARKLVEQRKLTKVAHKPSGKAIWLHMSGAPENLRERISAYLTMHSKMSIHYLGELALSKYLGVEAREVLINVEKE